MTSHEQKTAYWDDVAEQLRSVPGVEKVATAGWALLSGYQSNNFISMGGGPPTEPIAFFLNISPGWLDTMKISLLDGRDFRPDDVDPGSVIVNENFVKTFFKGESPIGKSFYRTWPRRMPMQIVGVVRDARYNEMREQAKPVAYIPLHRIDAQGAMRTIGNATIIVRSAGPNPLALASILRQEVPRVRSEFRVSNIRTQQELIEAQTVRERLLAMLALFFAAVALLLAGVGLYGVLDYSVVQRRREIGIRLAIGAAAGNIARLVTMEIFTMVVVGAAAGLALGMGSVRYVETLFYQVKATDIGMLAMPGITLFAAAFLAALPAMIQAVRIDPVETLRSE
jgi:predicted permease